MAERRRRWQRHLCQLGLDEVPNPCPAHAHLALQAGERIIAASKRPDGTIRKERRVRAGYVPQEEQQVYVSRGTAVSVATPGSGSCCHRCSWSVSP